MVGINRYKGSLLALVAMVASASSIAAEREETIPNRDLTLSLAGGPEALKLLLSTHLREYPGSFPHKEIFYMPNLDRLVYNQYRLFDSISKMGNYQKDMKARGQMLNFVIKVKGSYDIKAQDFDREQLDLLQSYMQAALKKIPAETFFSELAKLIDSEYDGYTRAKERDWWDFNGRYFEEKIVAFVIAFGMTGKGENLEPLRTKLKIEEGQIDYLVEHKLSEPAFELLTANFDPGRKSSFARTYERTLEKWEKRLKSSSYSSTRQRTIQIVAGDTLNIFEVHPHLAVLRGFVGNDCSTDVSFGFPYSPFERTYYVADQKMKFLGYVALSIVEFRGRRSLFFHTIAGPKITHAHSDIIMRAFYSLRKQIGGQTMVLPEDHRIGENINFHPIDEMMRKYVRDVEPERVTWLDENYRAMIAHFGNDMFYDNPERNRYGRLFDQPTDNIEVTVSKRPFLSPLAEPLLRSPEPACRYFFY